MRFLFCRNRDSVKNGILISIRRTGDGFHPGLFTKFNTTNVECMSDMFRGCERLTALDLPNFDTSKVTNMAYMFYGCRSLTALGLSNFDVSKITDMMGMFDGCVSLTEECRVKLKAQGFTVMW